MEIKVTSCADCPFEGDGYSCNLFTFSSVYVSPAEIFENYNKQPPPSCPLKQQSITVKLESNEQEN